MPSDRPVTQRALVGRRLRLRDVEVVTKYVLPFVDADWRTPFVVVDVLGRGPRVHHGMLRIEGERLTSEAGAADLHLVETIPLDEFVGLVHFDPWWAFRGIGGVRGEWVRAIVATNLAGFFDHGATRYKVHDLVFDDALSRLEALVAKDGLFRVATFRKGDIDLMGLRDLRAVHT